MDKLNVLVATDAHKQNNIVQIIKHIDDGDEDEKEIVKRTKIRQRAANLQVLAAQFQLKTHRSIWTLERHGRFWEKDVPKGSDLFFKENFRMSRKCFSILVEKLKGLEKSDTQFRKCIPLDKRIGIALYVLGSSAEYRTIGHLFGVSKTMVAKIFKDFCYEAWRLLAPTYLSAAFLKEEKINAAVKGFEDLGLPQCFGAIDGCHIEIKAPAKEATDYYNYKGWHSVVLLALVGPKYNFQYISVGAPGSCNDSKIYQASSLKSILESSTAFEEKSRLINNVQVPVYIIGDSAFRMSRSLLKPYPFSTMATAQQQRFNKVLSSCRRVVENAFGHAKARFRKVGRGLESKVENVNAIIKCVCVLHNFLIMNNCEVPEDWLREQATFEEIRSNTASEPDVGFRLDHNIEAEEIRRAISIALGGSDSDVGVDVDVEVMAASSPISLSNDC